MHQFVANRRCQNFFVDVVKYLFRQNDDWAEDPHGDWDRHRSRTQDTHAMDADGCLTMFDYRLAGRRGFEGKGALNDPPGSLPRAGQLADAVQKKDCI